MKKKVRFLPVNFGFDFFNERDAHRRRDFLELRGNLCNE